MSKTNISPHMGMAANLGRKPRNQPMRTQCQGYGLGATCHERASCRLYRTWVEQKDPKAVRIARVGRNECHDRIEAAK